LLPFRLRCSGTAGLAAERAGESLQLNAARREKLREMDILDTLLGAPGVYWGNGDGPESGTFVGRIEVRPILTAVLLHYEAFGASGLQHVEHALLARTATGLGIRSVIDTRKESMTFAEAEPGVFRLEAAGDMRIVIETPGTGCLSYAWWWAPHGEEVVERSRLVAWLRGPS
jgi:hypothetical protein